MLASQIADNKRRDWLAFVVILVGLGISALLAIFDKPWLSGATLAAIISYGVFGFLQKPKKPMPSPPPE